MTISVFGFIGLMFAAAGAGAAIVAILAAGERGKEKSYWSNVVQLMKEKRDEYYKELLLLHDLMNSNQYPEIKAELRIWANKNGVPR